MIHLETILTLALLGASFPVCGYAFGVPTLMKTAGERLSIGVLTGLGLLIWSISVVNLWLPITAGTALVCLWPAVVTILRPLSRKALLTDLAELLKPGHRRLGAGLAVLLPLLLLGPILVNPQLYFFDGTSNHDSFFWITSAEYLRTQSYLVTPAADLVNPAYNSVGAITGMYPLWGRMGGEGLVAFCAALVDAPAERVYLAMSAALLLPWLAASHLILRRYFTEGLSRTATVALVLLQPIFLFAHLNANLPNLLGALFGAAAVLATERVMDGREGRLTWMTLLALSVHGLFCCYPEMVPFVVAPAGLLWLRRTPDWLRKPSLLALWPILGWCGGALINLATTQRAWIGFVSSFHTGRANQNWANIFSQLKVSELFPGMITLSPSSAEMLGWILGTLVSVSLVAGLIMAALRARDRRGALLLCSGGAVLLAYTLYSGFHYGWQKSVQFTGVFAAVWTIAALRALVPEEGSRGLRRALPLAALLFLGGYLCFSTVHTLGRSWWWSGQKDITRDWSELQTRLEREGIKGAILVDSGSFNMAFFHGMWAPYFLPKQAIVYAERDQEAGGYQRFHAMRETTAGAPPTVAVLVGDEWARSWDFNSPRLIAGENQSFALLKKANRVTLMEGLSPNRGVPKRLGQTAEIHFCPHSESTLMLEIAPAHKLAVALKEQNLSATLKTEGKEITELSQALDEDGLWKLQLSLEAGRNYELKLSMAAKLPEAAGLFPYEIRAVVKDRVTIGKP